MFTVDAYGNALKHAVVLMTGNDGGVTRDDVTVAITSSAMAGNCQAALQMRVSTSMASTELMSTGTTTTTSIATSDGTATTGAPSTSHQTAMSGSSVMSGHTAMSGSTAVAASATSTTTVAMLSSDGPSQGPSAGPSAGPSEGPSDGPAGRRLQDETAHVSFTVIASDSAVDDIRMAVLAKTPDDILAAVQAGISSEGSPAITITSATEAIADAPTTQETEAGGGSMTDNFAFKSGLSWFGLCLSVAVVL